MGGPHLGDGLTRGDIKSGKKFADTISHILGRSMQRHPWQHGEHRLGTVESLNSESSRQRQKTILRFWWVETDSSNVSELLT